MEKEYSRTGIFVINTGLWTWAKYQSAILGFNSVSEYLFDLIKKEKELEETQ